MPGDPDEADGALALHREDVFHRTTAAEGAVDVVDGAHVGVSLSPPMTRVVDSMCCQSYTTVSSVSICRRAARTLEKRGQSGLCVHPQCMRTYFSYSGFHVTK